VPRAARQSKGAILSGRMAPFGTPKSMGRCFAALCAAAFARVILFPKENHPCATPRERKGCALLCNGVRTKLGAAFDLICSLPPLPLCGGVTDRTHVSFRTRSAAAAKRNKKHPKSSEEKH